MGGEVAVSLKDVSKCYKRYGRPVDRLKELLLPGKSQAQEFWALRGLNLEIARGETLGIVGQNGSGKSTLLQIIAGTLTPTTGQVQVQGRVSALLELGSGFNPEFTGRQNVFFNGRLLGLSQEEITDRFEQIVAFAEIGDFLDQPVKTYSSGMFVRLAFAVAANTSPDVLIVDEALAVGDVYFQQKCFEHIRLLREAGTTLLFVSHDMGAVYRLCDRAILLEQGEVVLASKARQVIDLYEARLLKKLDSHSQNIQIQTRLKPEAALALTDRESTPIPLIEGKVPERLSERLEEVMIKQPEVEIEFIRLLDEDDHPLESVVSDQVVQLAIGTRFLDAFDDPHIGLKIRDRTGMVIFETNTYCMGCHAGAVEAGTLLETRFTFRVALIEGEYTITIGVSDTGFGQILFKRALVYAHNQALLKVLRNRDAILWSGLVSLAPVVSVHKRAYV